MSREYKEQCAYFQWVNWKRNSDPRYLMIGSTQNGMNIAPAEVRNPNLSIAVRKMIAAKAALKAGLPKGFPDIFCLIPSESHHGLFLELKIKPNKPSPEQIDWLSRLNHCGYQAFIVWSWNEAASVTEAYMAFTKPYDPPPIELSNPIAERQLRLVK